MEIFPCGTFLPCVVGESLSKFPRKLPCPKKIPGYVPVITHFFTLKIRTLSNSTPFLGNIPPPLKERNGQMDSNL